MYILVSASGRLTSIRQNVNICIYECIYILLQMHISYVAQNFDKHVVVYARRCIYIYMFMLKNSI